MSRFLTLRLRDTETDEITQIVEIDISFLDLNHIGETIRTGDWLKGHWEMWARQHRSGVKPKPESFYFPAPPTTPVPEPKQEIWVREPEGWRSGGGIDRNGDLTPDA